MNRAAVFSQLSQQHSDLEVAGTLLTSDRVHITAHYRFNSNRDQHLSLPSLGREADHFNMPALSLEWPRDWHTLSLDYQPVT